MTLTPTPVGLALAVSGFLGIPLYFVLKGSDTDMPTDTVTRPMKLSEAIIKGIAMRPKRAHGVYFAGKDRSDVLGAAYQGSTGKSEVHNYQVGDYLERTFPILKKKVMNPETGELKTLKTVLRSLNDKHRWKRKNVVRFVSSVEGRLGIAH
jgi:hypothetical protein